MSIAKLVSTIQGSTDGGNFTTTAISTTGASALVVCIADDSEAGVPAHTLTDSPGNTYGAPTVTNADTSGSPAARIQMWVISGPLTSGTHTFTTGNASGYGPSVYALALSNTATVSATDQTNSANNATGTTIQPGSITPSVNNTIVITALAATHNLTSVNAPFTPVDQSINVDGNHWTLSVGFEIQTTATARNPTWTIDTSFGKAAAILSVKPSGGETITVDKWFRPASEPKLQKMGMVPSGTIGIKA